MEHYCDTYEQPPAFLKAGKPFDNFHKIGKQLSYKRWLNNYIEIVESS